MTGLIDVGGGFRDIYGAGVLDTCLENNINFDCCVAISAGSGNIAAFLAKQYKRCYRFYTEYMQRKETMSFSNLWDGKHLLDLDYIYNDLSALDGEDPIDYGNIENYGGIFNIIVTDAITGRPHYFEKKDLKPDNFNVIKASASIPIICGRTEIDGHIYYDGGISDPVPVKRALELGCDKIVLILTRPVDFDATPSGDLRIAALMDEECHKCANALRVHSRRYNRGIRLAKELEAQGKCLIIAPDDTCGVGTLTRDKEKLDALYHKGCEDGKKIMDFLK